MSACSTATSASSTSGLGFGFGAMRLPVLTDDDGKPDFKRIDYPLATQMLHHAIDSGVNYVDTAWMYHEDTSEVWLGEALKGGYRERVKVATKMPVWNVKKPDDFDRILGIQLERLQDDHIDFYLLHGLDADHWRTVLEQGQLESAERALADGRIRHLGFSFHGLYEDFETIVAGTDLWEFVQIQFNYMDEDYQAGRKGLELAAGKGLGVIVMEPVRGGAIARNVPPQVQAVWDEAPIKRSPAEWALQWVWNEPEVSFLLSGMSTMRHVEEDLAFADRSRPGAARRRRSSRWWRACATCTASSAPSRARRAATACRAPRVSPSPTCSVSTTTRTCTRTSTARSSCTGRSGRERARRPVHRLRRVRGEVPAGHRHPRLDGEGAGVPHVLLTARRAARQARRNAVQAALDGHVSLRGVELALDVVREGQPAVVWLRIGAEPMVMNGAAHVTVAVDDITDRRRHGQTPGAVVARPRACRAQRTRAP